MKAIQYRGTVRGFQEAVLREIRKAAMRGDRLGVDRDRQRLQARLYQLQAQDLLGGEAA